jgi:hypothetical protein
MALEEEHARYADHADAALAQLRAEVQCLLDLRREQQLAAAAADAEAEDEGESEADKEKEAAWREEEQEKKDDGEGASWGRLHQQQEPEILAQVAERLAPPPPLLPPYPALASLAQQQQQQQQQQPWVQKERAGVAAAAAAAAWSPTRSPVRSMARAALVFEEEELALPSYAELRRKGACIERAPASEQLPEATPAWDAPGVPGVFASRAVATAASAAAATGPAAGLVASRLPQTQHTWQPAGVAALSAGGSMSFLLSVGRQRDSHL